MKTRPKSRYANFKLLSLSVISDICIAGLNRRPGCATVSDKILTARDQTIVQFATAN